MELLDKAVVGVVIGSILSIFGNLATQWIVLSKEARQWERQQQAEEKRRVAEEENQKRKSITDIYHNCISRLSLVVTLGSTKLEISSEEKLQLYKDTLHWLALLALHRSDLYSEEGGYLQNSINEFAGSPNDYAGWLLDDVKRLAMFDQALSLNQPIPHKRSPDERRAQVYVANEFRRKSAIAGRQVPSQYKIEFDISTLTPSQREKLWDMYNNTFPETFDLSLPIYDENQNQVFLNGGKWTAELDPTSSSTQEIFSAWEQAYDKTLESLSQTQKLRTSNQ